MGTPKCERLCELRLFTLSCWIYVIFVQPHPVVSGSILGSLRAKERKRTTRQAKGFTSWRMRDMDQH